jgi:hypothetical protein
VIKTWQAWVLLILLFGPPLAFIGFGTLWLRERGWSLYAWGFWIAAGVAYYALLERWTSSRRALLPPIDWEAPRTFVPHDRKAWELVQEEAERGDAVSIEELTTVDLYIDTGRRLARRLAAHYHPLSNDPIENVPVIELLTALELAAEDLTALCRQVPGGDMVTPAHWKRAVEAAGYINWANDVYSVLLPIFQPMTGLVRLGTQKLMVKPAWKNVQQNLMRWFYRAFVNRLGTHLIELYSGRLLIGADQYRRLTRKAGKAAEDGVAGPGPLTIAVAGARGAGKSHLLAALEKARASDLGPIRARMAAAGLDEEAVDKLKTATWVEVLGFTSGQAAETARERSTRRAAVAEALEADLLILVVAGTRDDVRADVAFARDWDHHFVDHPEQEIPPAVAVVAGADLPTFGGEWSPPHDFARGRRPREEAVRARMEALRTALPPTFLEVVAVGMHEERPFGVAESLLPALAPLLHRAERIATLRYFHRVRSRSKARRLFTQVGHQGKQLWESIRSARAGRK